MTQRCPKCEHEADDLSTYCSATENLVCQGRHPVDGCGAVLTPEERHYYGDCCEECEGEWCERIERWRRGGLDKIMDQTYGSPERFH